MQSLTQQYGVSFPSSASSMDTNDPSPATSSSPPPPPQSSAAVAFGKKVPSLDRPAPSSSSSAHGGAASASNTSTGTTSNKQTKPAAVRSGCAGLYCEGVALVDQPHVVLKSVLPPGNMPPHPCTTLMLQNGSYEDLHRQKEVPCCMRHNRICLFFYLLVFMVWFHL